MNLGDEAILEGILGELRSTIAAEITVFSRNPSDTLARHQVEHAISTRALTRRQMVPEIRKLDLLILGGGGILYDRDAEEYLREVFIANELDIPVIL
jgi:polysaccharide pyruvyl transferase WcaK-like protein